MSFKAKGHQSYCCDECRQKFYARKIKVYRKIKPKESKVCVQCDKKFDYINPKKKYCSTACGYAAWYAKQKISPKTVGNPH